MSEDENPGAKVLEEVFQQAVGISVADYQFKPADSFSQWYVEKENFILFPHQTLLTRDEALQNTHYPNVWVTSNIETGKFKVGVGFWNVTLVDNRLVGLEKKTNKKNKEEVVTFLNGLSSDWRFHFHKTVYQGIGESNSTGKRCCDIRAKDLSTLLADMKKLKPEWKKNHKGKGWLVPTVDLMVAETTKDKVQDKIKEAFSAFQLMNSMVSATVLKREVTQKIKKLNAEKEIHEENFKISKFKEAITKRIEAIDGEIEALEKSVAK